MSKKWYALLLMFLTMVLSGCSLKTASTAPADTTEVLATAATPLKSTEESTDSSQPATDSEVLTSSSLPEKLAMLIPAPEKKTHDDYFSEIRTENIRYIDGGKYNTSVFSHHFDDDGYLYVDYKIDGQRYSRRVNETFDCPFVDVRRNCKFKGTLRKSYFFSADEKSLIQLDPITAEAVAIYTAEVTLKQPEHGWKLGCNIVVFTEQDANGNWRVLRLYEPDGTIDVIEESIPTEPSLNIISNCEFLTMWENPAYTKAAETYGESIWNKLNITKPYPTTEEEKWLPGNEHFFHDVLPLEIYKTYGIFDRYVRYRNTLTGKTVTLGSTQYNCRFSTYILPDGTEWRLSAERREYEDGNYNMVRFWLYLPADQ